MANNGKEYELFIQDIYNLLNSVDGLSNVKIEHNIKLVGAANVEHQIDLFWMFCVGGVYYRVAIECKNYNKPVSKDRIQAFHAVLNDIGNITGIFVSKMGFQRGAKEYAQKYGIQLMEIRKPLDQDWKNRIKTVLIDFHVLSLANVSIKVFADDQDNNDVFKNKNFMAYLQNVIIDFSQMSIDDNNVITNSQVRLQDLINMLPMDKPGINRVFKVMFVNGRFKYKETSLPIVNLEINYDIVDTAEQIKIDGSQEIVAIVKNVIDGTMASIRKDGTVKKES